MRNLPVQALDTNDIRSNLIEFLKGDPAFKDFNFEASGIRSILNLLSYNTHYLGFYTKMLLDEAYVDTAHTRQALLSHAKRTGYVARGRRSARAEVQLKIRVQPAQEPLSRSIIVERGTEFTAANSVQDQRKFQVVDDLVIDDRVEDVNGDLIYTSPSFVIYEGAFETWRFVVDESILNQRFIIRDASIDIDSLRVEISPHAGSDETVEFKKAEDIFELDGESNVYFITTNEDGLYQIFFGDNVFGKKPANENVITCTYVRTNGETGNGAKTFIFNPPEPDPFNDYAIGNFEDYEVTTQSPSAGGMEAEDVDSLRFTIPHHYRRQNRIVTVADFRAVLLSEFRNIDSINVWGGEDNSRRDYGKVYVSIKPKFSDSLTSATRNEIKTKILNKYGMVGTDVVFVEPDFIDLLLTVSTKVDFRKTSKSAQEMQRFVFEKIQDYNAENMNRFDAMLSDVSMLDYVRDFDPAIVSIFSRKQMRKTFQARHGTSGTHVVAFGNPIVPGISSTEIQYADMVCTIVDDNGVLLLKEKDGEYSLRIGDVDYETGRLQFVLPQFARVKGYENLNVGIMKFFATPRDPDINTSENNIIRIADTKVIVK